MSNEPPESISITVTPTFRDSFKASLTLIRLRWPLLMIHAAFTLFGLIMLAAAFTNRNPFEIQVVLAALPLLFFTPVVTALSVWLLRRRNKLARGPFTHVFDKEGVHTTSAALDQTIRWAGVLKLRCTKNFLFVFIAPSRAFIIPVREIHDPNFLDDLRRIAEGKTNLGPGNWPKPPGARY
jgi:hypothetical protein